MQLLPRGLTQPAELTQAISQTNRLLPPGVVKVNYTVDEDWTGDPAIFFWVTLSDEASRRANLRQISPQVCEVIVEAVQPFQSWGLLPYFYFRSQSEQAVLKDPSYG